MVRSTLLHLRLTKAIVNQGKKAGQESTQLLKRVKSTK